MMPMFTTTEKDSVTLEVDLYRRALDVVFKIGLARNRSGPPPDLATETEETGPLDDTENTEEKQESYRFRIPFPHLDRLLEAKEPSTAGRAFIITATSVPCFWRKLHDPLKTLDLGSRHWDVWSCWFRQTGISFENRARASLPVSLKQSGQIINVGLFPLFVQYPQLLLLAN
jgi:RNA-dependent RNA polymerase